MTPSQSQTEPGLLPTAPETNTSTETSTPTPETTATESATATGTESTTATGTESATATGTEPAPSTETGTGTPTDSPVATRPHSDPKTIQINGKKYACSDLSVNACDKGVTEAFDKWGDKLEGFVNSDRLGTLGRGGSAKLPDGRIARLGLLSCMYMDLKADSTKFLEGAKALEPRAKDTDLLLFWLESNRVICPELQLKA
ncbi:hypothetical protein [Arthrobacter sp. ISL-65]|uniref:hypothetical protein n=1 Tax=Arthrobacter sp. ISL-65 TaxID=2819112 RepID=UPI001BE546E7|nr:hypothetical protein [Arthrobacter sp. ISL-65]MBT2550989.1 hypothetical protein [Arthrobacter sp. ISL-65]